MTFAGNIEILVEIEKLIEKLGEDAWEELDELIDLLRPHHHHQPTSFLFPGFYTTTPTGEIIMTTQGISLNTAYTGAIIFKDATGTVTHGPATGTLTLDNPANGTAALSADGQFLNVTATALPLTITYAGTNDAGVALTGPTMTFTLADVAVTFDFGPFTPGTTA